VNVNNQIGSLERDHTIATNLAEVGQRVRESCPSPSIIFGHSQRLLNYLQFAVGSGKDDDYRFYGSDYFFRDGFPVPAMGSMEADQPTPIQHVRRSFLRKAYSEMDQGERGKIQNQIMTDAIAQGKRVFLVMDASSLAAFRRSFISSSRFETATVQKWTDPSRMSALAARNLATLGADISGRGSPQTWMIVEVKLKPQQPATQPSTAPAGAAQAPATQPAPTLRELYDLLRR
jgi:hypothetical protein